MRIILSVSEEDYTKVQYIFIAYGTKLNFIDNLVYNNVYLIIKFKHANVKKFRIGSQKI